MKITKEQREEKLVELLNMDNEEKRKYNGWNGFVKGELFKDSNLFMIEIKAKVKRKTDIERERRNKKKNG